jgi:hypothetical protein
MISILECQTVRDKEDDLRVHHGWSIFPGALLVVQVAFSDGLPPTRRWFACDPSDGLPPLADGLLGASHIA